MIFIGADTHKLKHFLVILNDSGKELAHLTIQNTPSGFLKALKWAKEYSSDCLWGLENTGSLGRSFAEYLVVQEEVVYEMPSRRTARQRKKGRQAGKNDHIDALAIARNLFFDWEDMEHYQINEEHTHLHILTQERENLVAERTRYYNRLHQCLMYLDTQYLDIVGNFKSQIGIKRCQKFLKKKQRSKLRETFREQGQRLVKQIIWLSKQIKELETMIETNEQVIQSPLMSLTGFSELRVAKFLGELGEFNRFRSERKLAKIAGIAPLECSSGQNMSYRVNPGGNRQLNRLFFDLALHQKKWNPVAKAYYDSKLEEGKTKRMAMRCLKRKLVKIVYAMLRDNREYVMSQVA